MAAWLGLQTAGLAQGESAADIPTIYAVLVGINNAETDKFQALRYCESDAAKMEQVLRASNERLHRGQNIEVITSQTQTPATLDGILMAVKAAADKAGPQDTLLFYFCGHGYVDDNEPYLVTEDLAGELHQWIEFSDVIRYLSKSEAGRKIAVLDACHSSSGSRTILEEWRTKEVFLITSCREDQVSVEDETLQSGVFTHFLVQGLEGEADTDGNGTVQFNELRIHLPRSIKQHLASAYPGRTDLRMDPLLSDPFELDLPLTVVDTGKLLASANISEPEFLKREEALAKRKLAQDILKPQLAGAAKQASLKGPADGSLSPTQQSARSNAEYRHSIPRAKVQQALEYLHEYFAADAANAADPVAQCYLGLAHWLLAKPHGDFGPALQAYEEALRLEPGNVDAMIGKAYVLVDVPRRDEALRVLEEAQRLEVGSVRLQYAKGLVYHAQNLLEKAQRELETALALDDNWASIHTELGQIFYKLEDYAAARREFEKALELDGLSREANYWLGNVSRRERQPERAVEHYLRVLEINPQDASAYNGMGLAYQTLKLTDLANGQFKKALEIEPEYTMPAYNLGLYYLRSANQSQNATEFEMAEKYLRQAHAADSNSLTLNGLGNLFESQNRLPEAIDKYNEALELGKDWPAGRRSTLYYNLGHAQLNHKDYPAAKFSLSEAINLDPLSPDMPMYQLDLGLCQIALEDITAARASLRSVIKLVEGDEQRQDLARQAQAELDKFEDM